MTSRSKATLATAALLATAPAAYAGFFGPFNPVSEPSVLALFGVGLAGLIVANWLRRK